MNHCFRRWFTAALTVVMFAPAFPVSAQESASAVLLPAGTSGDLPLVEPNDNTVPAGTLASGTRSIELEIQRADWRVEGPEGPGLRVAAIGEAGRAPTIPAPLLRTEAGTRLAVTVHNRLPAAITVFGLQSRPAEVIDSFVVAPGAVETVTFEAGEPGTYLYWMREGPAPDPDSEQRREQREQLAGALVVDEADAPASDRIIVMNIFSGPMDRSDYDGAWVEALTMNGLSWPHSERMMFEVGERVRWRVVNASIRNHPMHLHGFYYSVQARGDAARDTIYAGPDRRLVVTETLRGRTTMTMEWTPTRPGTWLFHCHLSFHVSPEIRLPGAEEADQQYGHTHMAGLVTGIEVAPGPTDLVARGDPIAIDLRAVELPADSGDARYGFARDDGGAVVPGPVLTFRQYEAVDITVHNELSVPTGVHWHGLELDAWADGVPGWSASDGKTSPVIQPGESFTYRLSLMRPGTFIYHSHLDDVDQLTRGLYGALLVLPEGETYDPRTDHVKIFGWNNSGARGLAAVDLNGAQEHAEHRATVGETHRFRVINIAPAGNISAWITRGVDEEIETIPITLHAKDGADLPEHQRVPVEGLPRLFVGETADFTWIPEEPGTYDLRIGNPRWEAHFVQRWVVE